MGLQIFFNGGYTISWKIDQNLSLSPTLLSTIEYISASEEELEFIKYTFCVNPEETDICRNYTIPIPQVKTAIWYGDIAKTIIGNILPIE